MFQWRGITAEKESSSKIEIGMAGGDHFVVDEFTGEAEMAFQAFIGTHDYVARIHHVEVTHRLRVLFRRIFCGVLAEPALRGAMTTFAADAFGDFKGTPDQLGRRREGMAGETFRRGFRFAEIQNFRHALADVTGQRLICATVLVLNDPGGIFVLQNTAVRNRFHAAVATGGGAGAGANVFSVFRAAGGGVTGLRVRKKRRSQRNEKQNSSRTTCRNAQRE